MKRVLIPLILFLFSLSAYADLDKEISFLYMDKINELLEKGWNVEAEILLNQAMEYDHGQSGLWLQKAYIQEAALLYQDALESNVMALDLDRWEHSSFRESVRMQCKLLYRLKDYQGLLDFYSELPETLLLDQDLLFYASYSAFQRGLFQSAQENAEKGLSLYPEDIRYFGPLIMIDPSAYLPSYHYYWGSEKEAYDNWLSKIIKMQSPEKLLRYYHAQPFHNYFKDYLAVTLWDAETIGNYLEQYQEMDDLQVIMGIYQNSDDPGRSYLVNYLSVQEKTYFGDFNNDGISDATLVGSHGIWTYRLESNQDGKALRELKMDSKGLPLELNQWNQGQQSRYIYAQWPFIEGVEIHQSWESREYEFSFGQMKSTMPWGLDLLNAVLWVNDMGETIKEPQLLRQCRTLKKIDSRGILFRKYFLQDGEIFLIREDSDRNGIPDRLLWINQWKPMEGLRDLNEDGTPDLYEYYHQGKWEGIMLDSQQDGKGDYLESWDPVEILLWDFDQDNLWDSIFNKTYDRVIIVPNELGHRSLEDTHFWNFNYEKYWFQ